MWTDITTKSKVRLVWQEIMARTEQHGPAFRAELTVVKIDCAKSGHAGWVFIVYRNVTDLDMDHPRDVVGMMISELHKRHQLGPILQTYSGDEAGASRWFQHYSDEWHKLVGMVALAVCAKPEDTI